VSHHAPGRHRAPGRFNPVSEIAGVVAKSASPAVKTSAVLAASSGLVASFALPAQAAPEHVEGTTRSVSAAPAAVTAPAVPLPQRATAFGVVGVAAVAKPKPKPRPKPVAVRTTRTVVAAPAPRQSRVASTQVASRSEVRKPVAPPARPATGGVLGVAASLTGIPYVYGGTTPAGFDCSGFTQYVFRQVGISLPRTAEQQRQAATPVSSPQPGDLVFFGAPAYHVGIYAGNGMMYDSPRTGQSTALRRIWTSAVTYGRP
jgi:cell wall-associated NlpC family hydrolase